MAAEPDGSYLACQACGALEFLRTERGWETWRCRIKYDRFGELFVDDLEAYDSELYEAPTYECSRCHSPFDPT